MTVTVSDLIFAALPQDFKAKLISQATVNKITTTSWLPGDPTRTFIACMAQVLAQGFGTTGTQQLIDIQATVDGIMSTFAQGGFLKYASAVTPDPSVAQADGTFPLVGSGFLDYIADGIFNERRTGGPNGSISVQSNASLVEVCVAKNTPIGPILAAGGIDPYVYYSTTAYDGATLLEPVTRVKVVPDTATRIVDVYLANASGVAQMSDVTSVNTFLQATCVPSSIVLIVHPAVAVPLTISCDVYVPTRYQTQASTAVFTAISNFVNALAIGGTPLGGGPSGVSIAALNAAIFEAVTYVEDVENLVVNMGTSDITLATTDCATVNTIVPTIFPT